ncbi:hypothetical protein ISG33_14240 [Glaciecola sp. MH2013]|uniref:hypothetical protein n=1 Tax=Glaciecola sp. MH2013 TaxID=2785524 RepID=UPI0018A0F103|nr:hypothetical protein [Glaciecola sp. MH2013]MBF7074561.1 hypothetical protein [Glaciecola sp. MH2013]
MKDPLFVCRNAAIVLIALMLGACGAEEAPSNNDSASAHKQPVVQKPDKKSVESIKTNGHVSNEADATDNKETANKIVSPFPDAPKSLLINGIKMSVNTTPLKKGDTIFDHSVKQNAQLTGKIVVVLKADTELPEKISADILNNDFVATKLAPRTFSLLALSDSDLLASYASLENSALIEKVELGLFYGQSDNRETM